MKIDLPSVVGRGYGAFWRFRGRYRVVKGSRGSKKSKTAALWFIYSLMKYPGSNLLVIRKTYRTLKDSCFTDLRWAMQRLGVPALFECRESPLEIIYRPTGQKILFRGLDDPLKITSIAVEVGQLCWVWIEEAFEITREADFDTIDESIRGQVAPGLFKQITLTFNPWNSRHWLCGRFFFGESADTLAITTTYLCNEFLDEADREQMERLKERNPRRYRVAGLGEWGQAEGLVFENYTEEAFDIDALRAKDGLRSVFGLDFGYTNDPTALFCGLIDTANKRLWVFDELYRKGLSNERIAAIITDMGYAKERITADSAEMKSIDRLCELGLKGIRPARKGPDSIRAGIDFLQDYEIIVHPRCVNFLTEINAYMWDTDKYDNRLNKPQDYMNHLMDAMRYAVEDIAKGDIFSFN